MKFLSLLFLFASGPSLIRPSMQLPSTLIKRSSSGEAKAVCELARQLIRISSVTPEDNGCQSIAQTFLEKLGFVCETLRYENVTNLWAFRHGHHTDWEKPLLVFAGHTDVVPPGPLERWTHPPFEGVVHEDKLYGRGAVDMKGGIAAWLIGLRSFVEKHPNHKGTIGIILTSDEEGDAVHGTKMVVEELVRRGIVIDEAIVGEPSSTFTTGDMLKVGRRGSLGGDLTIFGIQGHVAYPEHSRNPIHESLGALKDLVDMEWDKGTPDFRPTTFQITNLNSGTGATNVVPGFKKVVFNLRFSPASTPESIKARFEGVLRRHMLEFDLHWDEITYPYETPTESPLVKAAFASVKEVAGIEPTLGTSGGTSDGRFLAAAGAHVVELGLTNQMIHKIDEHVSVWDLLLLSEIYESLLGRLLMPLHKDSRDYIPEEQVVVNDL